MRCSRGGSIVKGWLVFATIAIFVGCKLNHQNQAVTVFFKPSQSINTASHHLKIYLNDKLLISKDIKNDHLPKDRFVICFNVDLNEKNVLLIKIDLKEVKFTLSKMRVKCLNIFTSYDNLIIIKSKFKDYERSGNYKIDNQPNFGKFYDSLRLKSKGGELDTILTEFDNNRCLCDSAGKGYGY